MGKYNKLYVAALMAGGNIVNYVWGLDLGVDEEVAGSIVSAASAFLVWAVPNT